MCNPQPAQELPAGEFSYFVAGVEDELQSLIGGSDKMVGVKVMPQAQVALLVD